MVLDDGLAAAVIMVKRVVGVGFPDEPFEIVVVMVAVGMAYTKKLCMASFVTVVVWLAILRRDIFMVNFLEQDTKNLNGTSSNEIRGGKRGLKEK